MSLARAYLERKTVAWLSVSHAKGENMLAIVLFRYASAANEVGQKKLADISVKIHIIRPQMPTSQGNGHATLHISKDDLQTALDVLTSLPSPGVEGILAKPHQSI
ncbi:hypothetical protein V8C35DRAFT_132280 [Trichoderma chlorosporum]